MCNERTYAGAVGAMKKNIGLLLAIMLFSGDAFVSTDAVVILCLKAI